MPSSERKYEHVVYGADIHGTITHRHSHVLVHTMQELKEGYMGKKQYEFSLSGKGKLWLSGRAAYMPKQADWGVDAARAITLSGKGKLGLSGCAARVITLSVYAKVQGSTPTSMGQSVRTWDELMDRCEVPADTPQGEQEQRMLFMMEMVSVRVGLLYQMRDKISTRPPLKPNALRGTKVAAVVPDDFESALMSQSVMAEYSWQDVNMVNKRYAK